MLLNQWAFLLLLYSFDLLVTCNQSLLCGAPLALPPLSPLPILFLYCMLRLLYMAVPSAGPLSHVPSPSWSHPFPWLWIIYRLRTPKCTFPVQTSPLSPRFRYPAPYWTHLQISHRNLTCSRPIVLFYYTSISVCATSSFKPKPSRFSHIQFISKSCHMCLQAHLLLLPAPSSEPPPSISKYFISCSLLISQVPLLLYSNVSCTQQQEDSFKHIKASYKGLVKAFLTTLQCFPISLETKPKHVTLTLSIVSSVIRSLPSSPTHSGPLFLYPLRPNQTFSSVNTQSSCLPQGLCFCWKFPTTLHVLTSSYS